MKKLILLLLIAPASLFAQQTGIAFVEDLSMEEIKAKAKAKAENKYILIDCFASWCGPCKLMDREVFKNGDVGTQVNPNFVSLKIQFDIDTLKNPERKEHYALSKMVQATYKVPGLPTILFLDTNGHLLYQFSGARNIPEFLEITKSVSSGEFNYAAVKKRYKENPNDLDNLYQLISLSIRVDRDRVQDLLREYLTLNKGIRSRRDAQLVYNATDSPATDSFNLLKSEQKTINGYLGQGVSNDLMRDIVYYEVFQKKIMRNSPQGSYISTHHPDWSVCEKLLKDTDPENYTDLLDYIQVNFFQLGQFWDRFIPALSTYIARYGETVSDKKKIEYATTVAKYIDDRDLVAKTLNWTAGALEENVSDENVQTLKTLRGKLGKD